MMEICNLKFVICICATFVFCYHFGPLVHANMDIDPVRLDNGPIAHPGIRLQAQARVFNISPHGCAQSSISESESRCDEDTLPSQQMCKAGFETAMLSYVRTGNPGSIVQIGAHVGFEKNDPIAKHTLSTINRISEAINSRTTSKVAAQWLFVEASPTNYRELVKNLENHGESNPTIQFLPANVGIMATAGKTGKSQNNTMNFYSIHSDVDVNTGMDKRTGKQLPHWVTQTGSFSKSQFMDHVITQRAFGSRGLKLADYMQTTPIQVLSVSELLQRRGIAVDSVKMLLVDTEGFDCDIIQALDLSSGLRPSLIIFEHAHCLEKVEATKEYLTTSGYTLTADHENTYAIAC
eukprot:m.140978 g.140978  ORF g.140978 m.140978 type:complete len:350 (-) comp30154_c0_seq2:122-1171(-)